MSTTAEAMVEPADDHDAEPPDTMTPIAKLAHLDPRALAANPDNVRTNLGDLDPLAASIAACGALEPLVVIPEDGGHRIVAGHRRNAAAIIAEQRSVPCIVRPDLAATTASVVAMVVENTPP